MNRKQIVVLTSLVIIIILIGVFVVMALSGAATYNAVNSKSILSSARDTQRARDIKEISNAVKDYLKDNKNVNPMFSRIFDCKNDMAKSIGKGIGNIDLEEVLVDIYLSKMPLDPAEGSSRSNTGYAICKLSEGKYEIFAPKTENGSMLSSTY
jgi:hypothetical protein